jgi:hypothetical protein
LFLHFYWPLSPLETDFLSLFPPVYVTSFSHAAYNSYPEDGRQQVPPTYWEFSTKLHSVTSHEMVTFNPVLIMADSFLRRGKTESTAVNWPIVPTLDDRWWMWSSWCNENWQWMT